MRVVSKIVGAIALSAIVSPVWAYSIGSGPSTNVGGLDTLTSQTSDLSLGGTTCASANGSSVADELCWINSVLGSSFVAGDYLKTETVPYFVTNEDSTVIAFGLSLSPEYYLVKNAQWWALFTNEQLLSWAVIETSLLAAGFNLPSDGLTISHIGQFGDTPEKDLPEPGTLGLLGLGMLGIGFARRRRA